MTYALCINCKTPHIYKTSDPPILYIALTYLPCTNCKTHNSIYSFTYPIEQIVRPPNRSKVSIPILYIAVTNFSPTIPNYRLSRTHLPPFLYFLPPTPQPPTFLPPTKQTIKPQIPLKSPYPPNNLLSIIVYIQLQFPYSELLF